ncbi:MAG: protein-disulfide reductase DsbD family protein [Candidatus Omnitrophica bacterium]|nr:protein-disulfide reductase DsbD family protein [Candidatus Omnitrophota bacterium]
MLKRFISSRNFASHPNTKALIFILAVYAILGAGWVSADPVKSAHTSVELVSEVSSVKPGQPFWVALRFQMDPGWHIYWKNPGDSGLPPKVEWRLADGWTAGEIQWPHPKTMDEVGLTTYVYEDEVGLLVEMTPPQTISVGESVVLAANLKWLECEQICVPGEADVSLMLPVTNQEPQRDFQWKSFFAENRAKLPSAATSLTLHLAIVFAFLGGLILNLMPCVLPVLSLKVLNLVAQSQQEGKKVWQHGFLYSAGVVVSFWILAGIMLALRAAGQQIGWGFQFQSPIFVVVLSIVFLILALNLFGVFEIGTSLTTVSGRFQRNHRWSDSFLIGVLATVAATPCTAPFMGAAIGVALTQPTWVVLTIFTSLGLGMALPFLIFSLFPSLLKFLPRPGPWMIHLKRFFGILLLATVVWLWWVLALQLKSSPVDSSLEWQIYSPQLVEELRQEQKPVFIDFTAAWCLSCQVNERLVLNSPSVMKAFKEEGVVLVKADWTKHDEVITKALASFGKNSIPFYVLYSADPTRDPIILPEILTPQIVIKALKESHPLKEESHEQSF